MSDCDDALVIMRGWDWERVYQDCSGGFSSGPMTRSLSDAINQLAFDGHPDAADTMLSLLADGQLVATGRYNWRAYRGERYQNDGIGDISARRWQVLQQNLALPWKDDFVCPRVKLQILDGWEKDTVYPVAEWVWNENYFSTAQQERDDEWEAPFELSSFEELFSAWDIEVYCPVAQTNRPASNESSPIEDGDRAPGSVPLIGHGKGRPPKYDWEGALAHVAAIANTPDGLDTGPGAQAVIERLIADYFTQTRGDGCAPCASEIRKRANRVMVAIEALKFSLASAA